MINEQKINALYKKIFIFFIAISLVVFLDIFSSFYFQDLTTNRLRESSYGFTNAITFDNNLEQSVEFKKYCEANKDKCKNIVFSPMKSSPYYSYYYEMQLPSFLGGKCYAEFDFHNDGRVYDNNWKVSYGFGENPKQFICYGMLDGGNYPGYPLFIPMIFVLFLIVYLIGKALKINALVLIGKYALIVQLVLVISVILFVIYLFSGSFYGIGA